MEEQGVFVCFVDVPNSQIELIEPIDETSPIAGFLKTNPEGGQHHMCFEVEDLLARAMRWLKKARAFWASRALARMARRLFSSILKIWAAC